MLKILHARLQHYVNQELSDVRAGLRKGRAARDQTANICWIIQKAREFQENIYLCFIDYAKAFDYVKFSSVTQSRLTLCDPMDCSTPGFPVLHHLVELAQTHVHRIGDAIQPSHPLSCPYPPAFNHFQHQGLF